jgi:hypothetical protein
VELTVWPGEFFVNNPLDVKENYEHALDFAFRLSRLFEFGHAIQTHVYDSHFLPVRLSDHRQGLRYTLSDICTKFDAVPLSDTSRNRIKPDTRLKTKGHK